MFADDESLVTSVSFDQAGTYDLSLEVTQGGSTYMDEVTVVVDPVPDYSQWVAGYSLSDIDLLADPDFDDSNNLMEFATVSDPSSGTSRAKPDLTQDLASPPELLFTYRRLRALDPSHASGSTGDGYTLYGVSYTVEATDDPITWQAATSALTLQEEGPAVDNGDGSETVTVRLIPPPGNDTRWFVRLKVTAN